MRLNPFTMWWESRRDRKAMLEMATNIGEDMRQLLAQVTEHQTSTAHELFKLKNPWYERSQSTVGQPLTEEQEKIVREFNENSKLPEQIRRGFASGGHIGMRASLGRFGEAPSEQTRSTDDVYAMEPGDVNVTVKILGDTDLDDLIREDNAQRDQEAAENQELLEYLAQPPKE